ncbi:PIG-L family deacetylase [Dactylosporangium sp. NBC_01737]|uniref:PIG-L deacetylase family protein n=1 Tax=Dactylosporangium sp. NBC_01737 TaxID=2975959 RepID=UPI002E1108C4|nr:PIG-L family deacetylase [Dactylosporangium sp. NBC_01737]
MEQQVTEQVEKLGTIVSIWAHPDDETYLAGGLMAAAAANGQRVVCVSATVGEHGTDDAVAWPPERLGRTRRWEAAAAMAVLGVTDHRFLDYPDGGMAALDPAGPVERIAALLADVAPDTVLTFGPDGGTFHPDHQTISAWVGAAWDRAARPGRLLHATMTAEHLETWGERYEQWRVFMTDERPVGVAREDLALDVRLTGAALDCKIAALLAMHTQVAPAVALLGMDDFRALNAGEAFIEAP